MVLISLLDVGSIISKASKKCKKLLAWTRLLEMLLLVTSLSLVTWQILSSLEKIKGNPTGTTQEYKKADMTTTFSITFCKSIYAFEQPVIEVNTMRIQDFNDEWSTLYSRLENSTQVHKI